MALENDLFLRACRRLPAPRRPVWIMRQAGRYLPDYREVRRQVDFFTLCRTPELVARVTLQPVDQLGVDAAIVFSDILVVPQAMGMELEMVEGTGPVFPHPIRTRADADALRQARAEGLRYVTDAIAQTKRALAGRVPLIGFAGSPWTLLCYMVEGRGSKDFRYAKELLYREPELARRLLATLADGVAEFLAAQLAAGADAVQIFDTWGGLLGPTQYREFDLWYVNRIIGRLPYDRGPLILFSRGVHHSYDEMADSGADVLGLDWTAGLAEVRARVGDRVALQGNLDPVALYADPRRITSETHAMLAAFGDGPGLVANLGHGIRPDTDPDHARAFVRAVQEYASGG